jgi:hypothetical protein
MPLSEWDASHSRTTPGPDRVSGVLASVGRGAQRAQLGDLPKSGLPGRPLEVESKCGSGPRLHGLLEHGPNVAPRGRGPDDVGSAWMATFGCLRGERHRSHAGEPSSCSLPLVVRHERIDRSEIGGGRHVDRVQGTENWFCQRSGGEQQATIKRREGQAVYRLTSPGDQDVQRQTSIACGRSADRPRHLGQDELAGDQVSSSDERA